MFFSFVFKGVLPTAQRAAIVSGVELAVYDWIKKQLICRYESSDTIGTHFIASFTAGFAGAFASTPIDVVRVSDDNLSTDLC
jgi:solute carrier family 25 protein 14/30